MKDLRQMQARIDSCDSVPPVVMLPHACVSIADFA
jgi:hypothetical protein